MWAWHASNTSWAFKEAKGYTHMSDLWQAGPELLWQSLNYLPALLINLGLYSLTAAALWGFEPEARRKSCPAHYHCHDRGLAGVPGAGLPGARSPLTGLFSGWLFYGLWAAGLACALAYSARAIWRLRCAPGGRPRRSALAAAPAAALAAALRPPVRAGGRRPRSRHRSRQHRRRLPPRAAWRCPIRSLPVSRLRTKPCSHGSRPGCRISSPCVGPASSGA